MNNQKEIRRIMDKILSIDQRLERYNKRMDTVLKQTNYPKGITYDQLNKIEIQNYGQDIIFQYLE